MKAPSNYTIPYCAICDKYNHDIKYCKEYCDFLEEMRAKSKAACLERWERCKTVEEFEAEEESLFEAR